MMRFRGSVAMDDYLATLGLWRKPTARDKTCLFRAVSEQLFNTQCLHQRLKTVCINYVERHREALEEECKTHGQLDIVALSILFKRDFVIYREVNKAPVEISRRGNKSVKIVLCFSDGHHFDSVYPRSYIESAAICQSITYELLYKEVFGMEAPVENGQDMITTKPYKPRPDVTVSTSPDSISPPTYNRDWDCHHEPDSPTDFTKDHLYNKDKVVHKIVPFPYKVAKALAPDIYRNVELDAWIEAKKDLSLNGEVEDDDNSFSPGDKCQVSLPQHADRVFNAHIQEIVPDHGPITVFVEELGEKHKVPLASLKPLPQTIKPGWNSSDDGQSGYRKRKGKKKDFHMVIGINSNLPPRMQQSQGAPTEDLPDPREMGGAMSPVTYKSRPQFGSQHIINAAGHPVKTKWGTDNYGLPYSGRHLSPRCQPLPRGRPRSYSEGAASSGQPLPTHPEYATHGPVPPTPGDYTPLRPGCPGAEGVHTLSPPAMEPRGPVVLEAPLGQSPAPPAPPPGQMYTVQPQPVHYTTVDNINYGAQPSCDPNGSDIPLNDVATLRFFYNLGVEYYRQSVCMVPVPPPMAPVPAQHPPPPPPQHYTTAPPAPYTGYNHLVPTYVTVQMPMAPEMMVHHGDEYGQPPPPPCGGGPYSSQPGGVPPPPPQPAGGTVYYPYQGPPPPPLTTAPPPAPQPQYL